MEEDLIKRLLEMKGSRECDRLRVLDVKNDPFWVSSARLRNAEWVAKIWRERIGRETYDRGFHYLLVSLNVECPWGQMRKVHPWSVYMNVDSDFNTLVGAIRDARTWGLLPWDAIEDKKHVGLERWVDWGSFSGMREMRPFEGFDGDVSASLDIELPEVYEVGEAYIYDDDFAEIAERMVKEVLNEQMTGLTPSRYQPYYVAVVSEKSGLRKVARDSLNRLGYGFDFLNFEGQSSATVVKDFLDNRLLAGLPPEHPISKKKIRIFYLSDYDYAGRSMVPAFIQKLLFCVRFEGVDLDIKVKSLALTKEIVEKFDLPPAPVPIRELGGKTLQDRWLKEFGKIVELEALFSLHPGALEEIIVKEVERFIDPDLARQVKERLDEVEEEAEEKIKEALEDKREEWLEARDKLQRVFDEINETIRKIGIRETLRELKRQTEDLKEKHRVEQLVSDYRETLKDIYVDYEAPELDLTSDFEVEEEEDEWLYDSKRNPIEQAKILRDYKP